MNAMNLKQAIFLLIAFCSSFHTLAQQPEVKDTSFTFNSAFISTKAANPNATIPQITTGDTVQSVHDLVYCKVGDRPLLLDVFYPKQQYFKGNLPAVLMVHGGGWHSGNRTMHWPMAQKMAARGYVVFTAEYRLSTAATYPAGVNDLKSAIKYIRANAGTYRVDANTIAAWGYSAGGQLAALIGSTNNNPLYKGDGCNDNYSDAVQAVIDVDGILAFIHPESVEGDDSKKLSSATKWFGASKTARPDLWQQASALNHVNKQTAPILFINSSLIKEHAGRDDMIKKLDSLHIYHEIHAFPDTPHTFIMFEPWFTPALNYAVNFLDRTFKKK
jgi:pectinesterase